MINKSFIFNLIICLIFLVSASLYSQDTIRTPRDFADMVPNGSYTLMNDITVTQMYTQTFSGHFNGNNKKITVQINENATSVGLFSQLGSGGSIRNLVVDGSVIGGQQSGNVGGIVGQLLSGHIAFSTNLADVTGDGNRSSVGGVIGAINMTNHGSDILDCVNNGTITGGYNIGGVIGAIFNGAGISLNLCKNAGIIKSNSPNPHCMAGIIGVIFGECFLNVAVNIGKILSSKSEYAGGIVGYFENGQLTLGTNAGIVDGAMNSVGGIVGGGTAGLFGCINTNWVDSGSAQYFGAIVGMNNGIVGLGIVDNCYYDNQMCAIGGINNQDVSNSAEGRPTALMIGSNLPIATNNPYPQLYPMVNYFNPHPIDLLAAAPIYPYPNPYIANITQDFKVSNNYWFPIQFPYPYRFRWTSVNGFINIPANSDDAFINPPFGVLRQDTLRVILPGEPYTKDVPIWLR